MGDFLTELARVRAETEHNLAVLEDLYRASLSSKKKSITEEDTASHWDAYHSDHDHAHQDTHYYSIDEHPADLALSWEKSHDYDHGRYSSDADFPAPPDDQDLPHTSSSSIDDSWRDFDVDHYSPPPGEPRAASPGREETHSQQQQLKYTIPKPFNLSQSRGKTRSEKLIEVRQTVLRLCTIRCDKSRCTGGDSAEESRGGARVSGQIHCHAHTT